MGNNQNTFSYSAEPECKRLVEIATLELYQNNCFRVLDLPVDACERVLSRQIQLLKFQINDSVTMDSRKNPVLLQEACQRIRNLEYRAVDEFFWFWARDEKEYAQWIERYEDLRESDEHRVYQICRSLEASEIDHCLGLHNYTILVHSLALEMERARPHCGTEWDKNPILRFLWKKALDCWSRCIRQEQTWDFFKERVRTVNDPRLTTGFVRRFRNTIPFALCFINIQLSLGGLEKDDKEKAYTHLNYVKESGWEAEVIEKALKIGCSPLLDPLRVQCREIKQNAKQNPKQANEFLGRNFAAMEKTLTRLQDILPKAHPSLEPICDEIATAIYECQIANTSNGGSLAASRDWLLQADLLPVSSLLHHRLQENIRVLRLNLENELCWFCKEFLSEKTRSFVFYSDTKRFSSYSSLESQNAPISSTILIPRCSRCESFHSKEYWTPHWGTSVGGLVGFLLGSILEFMIPLSYGGLLAPIGTVMVAGVGFLSGRILAGYVVPDRVKPEAAKWEYPKVKESSDLIYPAKPYCAEQNH